MLFEADEPKPGTGGRVALFANDERSAKARSATVPVAFTALRYGHRRDNGLVVDRAYEAKAPYAFTGTVKNVVFDLNPGSRRTRRPCTRPPSEPESHTGLPEWPRGSRRHQND
jgi:arylsulfatase